ncbi:unnamed protein product [Rotaria sp. Silwood1]|nr:unnamed protein product [Rotaria sp. Silwood1]CAF1620234.1 unnamed protein product [Rotaria sp. Silwood1]CAF3717382.1 unnamed protein product [Rotaria sp. Silwood1]CAF3765378.1 unnamed protein product [Rotaria sp. Silwood1]CAF4663087.1 unnamed protein product [Rotaria sp. Silwood1]
MLSSLLFPVCAQILLDQNNIQSQYISPKGLSGRVIPAGTFPTKILALEYLYGLQCSIPNLPPRPYNIQTVDLVRIAYDNEYLIMLKTKYVDECEQYLMTNVSYGSYDRGDQGNVACRSIHAYFVSLFPSVHCSHVGPTGGGACTDKTIDFYYNQPNFLGCACKQ